MLVVSDKTKDRFAKGISDELSDENAELFNDARTWQRVVQAECLDDDEKDFLRSRNLSIEDICSGRFPSKDMPAIHGIMKAVNTRLGVRLFTVV